MRTRPGYALLWIIVATAAFATFIAVITPLLQAGIEADRNAVDSTATMLRAIGVGMNSMELGVARKFPGRPSELTNLLTQVGGYRIMSCWNQTYSNADSTTAVGVQPFTGFYIPPQGLWTPIGRLRDSIENRNGLTATAFLWLDIPGVRADLAILLDSRVDGTAGSAADTVQYATPVNDTTTVRFRVTPREFNRC